MLRMRPVERGVFLPRARVLAVADLHLGYEFELFRSGLRIPSQTERMKGRLTTLIEQVGPKELIVAGDFKHNIPYVGDWEYEELERFARDLALPITVIRGNHDVGLTDIVHAENVAFGRVRGETRGKVGFFHGHTWPSKSLLNCRYLVMGHSHPALVLKDSLGVQTRLSCFVESNPIWPELLRRYPSDVDEYNKRLKVIILPSFNQLLGGTGFNVETPLGPLAKNCLDIPNSRILLEDGTIIGKIKDLPLQPKK
jgi:putative SbcD/Mre11-related phosphoesterase